jgi:bacterial/archaeal transporter family-2 protein
VGTAAVLAFTAGIAGAVQVAVMGRFGERVGTIEALAFSLLLSTLLAGVALLAARGSLSGLADAARAPKWLWVGSLMGTFVVLTITIAAPRIGVLAVTALLIAGQLGTAIAIDRYGLFGVERIGLAWPRVVGIALLVAGAALTLRR